MVQQVTPLDNLLHTEMSSVDDTITWTKGEILGRGAYGTVSNYVVKRLNILKNKNKQQQKKTKHCTNYIK